VHTGVDRGKLVYALGEWLVIQLTLASQDDFLLATASGQVSVKEVLRVFHERH
jgi:hypothetical protein